MKREIDVRKKLVRKVCDKYKNGLFDTRGNMRTMSEMTWYDHNIYVDGKHRLLYCNIPKVGCTNWKRILLALREDPPLNPSSINKTDAQNKSKFITLSGFHGKAPEYFLKEFFKFMFVRDPYERLLSAYVDKFENPNEYYAGHYGVFIKKLYRKNATKEELATGSDVTFEEFIRYVTDPRSYHNDPEIWSIFRREGHNRHWARYMDLCNPCIVDYDFIGHYENIDEEAEMVLHAAQLDDVIHFPTRSSTNYSKAKTSNRVHEMFGQLPVELRNKVKEVYAIDFELFGYNVL